MCKTMPCRLYIKWEEGLGCCRKARWCFPRGNESLEDKWGPSLGQALNMIGPLFNLVILSLISRGRSHVVCDLLVAAWEENIWLLLLGFHFQVSTSLTAACFSKLYLHITIRLNGGTKSSNIMLSRNSHISHPLHDPKSFQIHRDQSRLSSSLDHSYQ